VYAEQYNAAAAQRLPTAPTFTSQPDVGTGLRGQAAGEPLGPQESMLPTSVGQRQHWVFRAGRQPG
jgi:hypothetical protein